MKSVEQVARGVALYYDEYIRPSLSGGKGVLYGVAIGSALAHPERMLSRYGGLLETIGLVENGQIDIDTLASEMRKQMGKGDGKLPVHILNDDFTFTVSDVDTLVNCIERS